MARTKYWALLGLLLAACSGNERPPTPDSCQYALDGECDEPTYCDFGTDTTDCGDDSCQYSNDGECDEPDYCAYGTDTTDCREARLCEPQCGTQQCGRDPVCNKPCGNCPAELTCNANGMCIDNRCQPDCGARTCGPDPVCGVSCGECMGTFQCTSEGTCVDTACQPQCGDRVCGLDPVCNQSCGTCGEGESCTEAGQCQAPCDFPRITQDTPYTKDVSVITVTGQVTLNGGVMPDDGILDNDDRGALVFREEGSGSTVWAPIGETGPGTFNALLFAGTYTVSFTAEPGYDQDVLPPGQTTKLAEGVQITASGALNYDLTTIDVVGAVTVNGAVMADDGIQDNDDRGYIVFRDRETGSTVSAGLGETGPARYATSLFAGTFDVEIVCEPGYDQDVLPPGQRVRVAEAMELRASGALQYDLRVVELTGEVKMNGNTMPDDPIQDNDDRAYVVFRFEATGSEVYASIGENGPGIYRTRLVAGRYVIDLQAEPGYDQGVLPPGARHRLDEGREINATGNLGFDVPVVVLTGQVRVNGAQMADDTILDNDDRGYVVFRNQTTSSAMAASFGETGPAVYQTTIFAGQYDVEVHAEPGYDQSVLPPGVFTEVQSGLQVTASGGLDFDVQVVNLTGQVRLNGGQMPDDGILDNDDRGYLLFRDTTTDQTVAAALGEMGAAIYQTPLFAGTYDVRLAAEPGYDQDVLPAGQTTELQAGVALNNSGSLDFDARTHRLFGQITVNGQPMADDTILDNDDRAWLRLVDKTTGSGGGAWLGETGPATFDIRVFEGSYDVFLNAEPGYDQSVLPPGQSLQLEVGCP